MAPKWHQQPKQKACVIGLDGVSAKLDHHMPVVEPGDVGQGLDEHPALGDRVLERLGHGVAHVTYSELSRT